MLACKLTCCCPLPVPGASVINTRCSETYETRTALLSLFGIPLWYHSQSPRVILQVGTLRARPRSGGGPAGLVLAWAWWVLLGSRCRSKQAARLMSGGGKWR